MGGHSKRVLLVDDSVDTCEMTAEVLRAHGFEVVVASSAHAALALLPTFSPEVALLDIALPEMDGYELARRIAISQTGCRLIALTGYGSESDRQRARNAGFAAHLTKPVRIAAIIAAISGEDAALGSPVHRTAEFELAPNNEAELAGDDEAAAAAIERKATPAPRRS